MVTETPQKHTFRAYSWKTALLSTRHFVTRGEYQHDQLKDAKFNITG